MIVQDFPGKPLASIAGKPMIQWVYETSCKSNASNTVVATDDARIAKCVKDFGGEVVITDRNHPSGTDRVAEATQGLNADIILNIQGDEPLLEVSVINDLIDIMLLNSQADIATAAVPMERSSTRFSR